MNDQYPPKHYPPRRSRRYDDGEPLPRTETGYVPVGESADYDYSAFDTETDSLHDVSGFSSDEYAFSDAVDGYRAETGAPFAAEPVFEPTPHSSVDAIRQRTTSTPPRRNAQRRKQRRRRTAILLGVAVAVLVMAAVSVHYLGGLRGFVSGAEDYEGKGSGEVTVVIPEGASGREIAAILHDADVVKSAQAFENAFTASSLAKGIQAGTYTLKKQMAASEALALLLNPAAKADLSITVPEGFTKQQVRDRLVSVGNYSQEEVEAALADATVLGLPPEANGDAEGWLAPDTYTIGPNQDAASLLSDMVALTISRLDKAGVAPADRHAVLTKGSIIEREVNKDEYYPMVARVVENRLVDNPQTHGLLQMDSTVLYGVGQSGGIPTADQLKADTPYNTYVHKGLPPTPIGAVGEKAIAAVVHPADGDWLYYVTVNLETGETKFASTIEEHDANVKQLRQYCKDNPSVCQ